MFKVAFVTCTGALRIFLGSDTRMPLHGCDYSVLFEQSERPLLDRIDLHIEVPAVAYKELRGKDTGVGSAEMRTRVGNARAIQQHRGFYNGRIPSSQLRKLC